nr:probable glutamyl endopeptidase, chloroplastic isoform X2 [Ipomoea batatas]
MKKMMMQRDSESMGGVKKKVLSKSVGVYFKEQKAYIKEMADTTCLSSSDNSSFWDDIIVSPLRDSAQSRDLTVVENFENHPLESNEIIASPGATGTDVVAVDQGTAAVVEEDNTTAALDVATMNARVFRGRKRTRRTFCDTTTLTFERFSEYFYLSSEQAAEELQEDNSTSKLSVWVADVETGTARPLYLNVIFDNQAIFQILQLWWVFFGCRGGGGVGVGSAWIVSAFIVILFCIHGLSLALGHSRTPNKHKYGNAPVDFVRSQISCNIVPSYSTMLVVLRFTRCWCPAHGACDRLCSPFAVHVANGLARRIGEKAQDAGIGARPCPVVEENDLRCEDEVSSGLRSRPRSRPDRPEPQGYYVWWRFCIEIVRSISRGLPTCGHWPPYSRAGMYCSRLPGLVADRASRVFSLR